MNVLNLFCSFPALIVALVLGTYFYNRSQNLAVWYEDHKIADFLFGVCIFWVLCICATTLVWITSPKPLSDESLRDCIEKQGHVTVAKVDDSICSASTKYACVSWTANFEIKSGQIGTVEFDDTNCVVSMEPSTKK